MKTLFLILALACSLAAETRQEADLRKQLAATQAELAAEKARTKALQSVQAGTQKLTEAVKEVTETSKKNAEEVKDKIEEAQANDHKLAETVKSSAAEAQKATKKLVDVVSVEGSATVSALSSQMRQQERSAQSDARAIAKDLKLAKAALEKANEDRRISEREQAAAISELNRKADVLADKKDARLQGYAFWTMVVTMVFVPLATAGGIYLTRKVEGVHGMVNGQRTAMELKIKELEDREKARQILEALHTTPPKKAAGVDP